MAKVQNQVQNQIGGVEATDTSTCLPACMHAAVPGETVHAGQQHEPGWTIIVPSLLVKRGAVITKEIPSGTAISQVPDSTAHADNSVGRQAADRTQQAKE